MYSNFKIKKIKFFQCLKNISVNLSIYIRQPRVCCNEYAYIYIITIYKSKVNGFNYRRKNTVIM